MGMVTKILGFFGVSSEEVEQDGLGPTVAETTQRERERMRPVMEDPIQLPPRAKNEKIVNHPDAIAHKVMVFKPTSVDSTQSVMNELLEGRSLVINLEDVDTITAQRIMDTLSGALYAVNGNLKRIARQIYMITPSFVEMIERDLTGRGNPFAVGSKRHD